MLFLKNVPLPCIQNDWMSAQLGWIGAVADALKALERYAALGADMLERVRRDANRVSFDGIVKAMLAMSRASSAALDAKTIPPQGRSMPNLIEDVDVSGDLFKLDFLNSMQAVEKSVMHSKVFVDAAERHCQVMVQECDEISSKVEAVGCDLGPGPNNWKAGLADDATLEQVLERASTTVSTLDPKEVGLSLAKLAKARPMVKTWDFTRWRWILQSTTWRVTGIIVGVPIIKHYYTTRFYPVRYIPQLPTCFLPF